MVERCVRRLATWKTEYLTLGRRMTLITGTMTNVPIYYLFVLEMPMRVLKSLRNLQRDSLCDRLDIVFKDGTNLCQTLLEETQLVS